jgi:hypothetical protein
MTGKQAKKLRKRARIAAVIATQNAWISELLWVEAGTRRERDTLFAAAQRAKEVR